MNLREVLATTSPRHWIEGAAAMAILMGGMLALAVILP